MDKGKKPPESAETRCKSIAKFSLLTEVSLIVAEETHVVFQLFMVFLLIEN